MKKIRINFCGYNIGYDYTKNLIYQILSTHFDVEITEKPDYLIVGSEGIPFQYKRYDCIRIRLETENFSPDFCDFDYWIGFDNISFGDRFFRLQLAFQENSGNPWIPKKIDVAEALEMLENKKYFCNFIYRHESSSGIREKIREQLSKYKDVISIGNYLNSNDGNAEKFNRYSCFCSHEDKMDCIQLSKFTISGESLSYPGFATEKIIDAFKGHSIPVYYGTEDISEFFNEKAFIWCRNSDDIENVCQRLIQIDNDDSEYIRMLSECPLADESYTENLYKNLIDFILNIFDKPLEMSKRRPRYYLVERNNDLQREYALQIEKNYEKEIEKSSFKSNLKAVRDKKGLLFALLFFVKCKAIRLIKWGSSLKP